MKSLLSRFFFFNTGNIIGKSTPLFLADLSLLSRTMIRIMAKRRIIKMMDLMSIRMEVEGKMPWW